jgi:hypothetical protein
MFQLYNFEEIDNILLAFVQIYYRPSKQNINKYYDNLKTLNNNLEDALLELNCQIIDHDNNIEDINNMEGI